MTLKKLTNDHYIIVDDSEIKEGDWYYHSIWQELFCLYKDTMHNKAFELEKAYKITHSTQPLEWFGGEIIFLSEVKELVGVVDVEKKALEISPVELDEDEFDVNETHRVTWIDGYNQALEDNKEKKYTEEDIKKAIEFGHTSYTPFADVHYSNFIQFLQPKTEWNVDFVDGKLKLK